MLHIGPGAAQFSSDPPGNHKFDPDSPKNSWDPDPGLKNNTRIGSRSRHDPWASGAPVRKVLISHHHQYSVTELGLQRTARPEYYRRDTVTTWGPHVCGGLISTPILGAVYLESTNQLYGSCAERKRGPQANRRQLEGRNPESLVYGINPSQSSFSPPQDSHAMATI